jgi:hypothetical protein
MILMTVDLKPQDLSVADRPVSTGVAQPGLVQSHVKVSTQPNIAQLGLVVSKQDAAGCSLQVGNHFDARSFHYLRITLVLVS